MTAWRDCWGFLSWNGPYFLCDGHIYCAMVAERIFCLFSVGCSLFILSNVSLPFCQLFLFSSISCFSLLRQLFLFSFHWILLFSCRRRLCALSFTAHFYPAHTSWCEHHVELSAAYLFLTSDLHFLHTQSVILLLRSGFICCVRKVKRKNPVSFTPNPLNHSCLLHPCEGWRRKTKNSWRARMRVGLGQRFFTGKQIAAVCRIIYSTNWEERLNHCYSYLVLARSDALPASVVCLLCAVTRNVRLRSVFGWVDNPVKRQRKLTPQIALRLVVYQAWGAYVVLVAWLYVRICVTLKGLRVLAVQSKINYYLCRVPVCRISIWEVLFLRTVCKCLSLRLLSVI